MCENCISTSNIGQCVVKQAGVSSTGRAQHDWQPKSGTSKGCSKVNAYNCRKNEKLTCPAHPQGQN